MEAETTLQPLLRIVPAAQNNINTKFIVLDKERVPLEGNHKTCRALVADDTAAVHFQLWGDECDAVEPGDILLLTKGIFSDIRNNFLLRAGKRGKLEKVGEFTMNFVETPNLSEMRWAPHPQRPDKYVQQGVISTHSRLFESLV
ncbi:Nucleic acid-binding [Perilla frutescens var. hirtella]|nr:Nucleic acid-binding [Perilla frutescens var. hirtella]